MNGDLTLGVLFGSLALSALLACRTASDSEAPTLTESDVAAAYAAALAQEAPHIGPGAYVLEAAVGPGLADIRGHTLPPDSVRHSPAILRALLATGFVTRVCEPQGNVADPDPRCPRSRGHWVAGFSKIERAAQDTLEFVGAFGIMPDSMPNLPAFPPFGFAKWYRAVRHDGTWAIVSIKRVAIT